MPFGSRSAGCGSFAIGMKTLLRADRCQDDRGNPGLAEELDRQIDLAHIDESAQAQSDAIECLAVGSQRHVTIDTGQWVLCSAEPFAPRGRSRWRK